MTAIRLRWVFLSLLIASVAWSQQAPALRIVVLEGEDAVNIIMQRTAVQPVVEVRDRNNLPVAGVAVVFLINGNGGTFAGGARQISVVTDAAGRATTTGLNGVGRGAMEINVRANFQGQTATTTIHQTNFQTAAEATQAGRTPSNPNSASSTAGGGGAGTAAGGAVAGATAAGTAAGAAAGTTAGTTAATGGGILGLSTPVAVGVGAAAVGGVVVATKAGGGGSSSPATPDCTSQTNQFINTTNNLSVACPASINFNQATCDAAFQSYLNALGSFCSCVGFVNLDAATKAEFNQSLAELAQLGFNVTAPAACTK